MFLEVHQEKKEVIEREIKDVQDTVNLMETSVLYLLIMLLHLLDILVRYSFFHWKHISHFSIRIFLHKNISSP